MSLIRSIFINVILVVVTALSMFSACDNIPGPNPSSSQTELKTTAGDVQHIDQRVDLVCDDVDFRLFRITLKGGTEAVTLFKGKDEVRTERLPNQAEVKKFKLDPLRKSDKGFDLSVEYGTRFYHSKRFEFACEDGSFSLLRISSERFDTSNPAKISRRNEPVGRKTPWEEFGMRLYLID
jgi:hypothetical protein